MYKDQQPRRKNPHQIDDINISQASSDGLGNGHGDKFKKDKAGRHHQSEPRLRNSDKDLDTKHSQLLNPALSDHHDNDHDDSQNTPHQIQNYSGHESSPNHQAMLQLQRNMTIISASDEANDEKIKQEMQKKIDANESQIEKLQKECLKVACDIDKRSLNTVDCQENATVFNFMKYQQREKHIQAMWWRTFHKAKAGAQILQFTSDITKKIQILGIHRNIEDISDEERPFWFIILPNNPFKAIWNMVLIIILCYTASYMPYKTCFIDEPSQFSQNVDNVVDLLFCVDIIVNFLSALELQDGRTITSPKIIAQEYIRTWFVFDFLSVLPFEMLETFIMPDMNTLTREYIDNDGVVQTVKVTNLERSSASEYNQLIRLMRLPRLYRMMKILRLFKILKMVRKNKIMQKLSRALKMNAAILRMVQGMSTAVLITHIFACFWYLGANLNQLSPDTWVFRKNLIDQPEHIRYLWAMYWATQTVTTVGFGDVPANTEAEIFLCLVWMLVGVIFYAFIIGNFQSIIAGNTQLEEVQALTVAGMADLARRAKIPYQLKNKMKTYIENNYCLLFNIDEEDNLVKSLPPSLRDEILRITYGEIIESIQFFKRMKDGDFLWKILPVLKSIKLDKGDVLYWKGDNSDELYFIVQGSIKLHTDSGNPFIRYSQGQMFGDSDTLLDLPRDGKAVASTHLLLKSLSVKDFEGVFINSQDTCLDMIVKARKKRDKHLQRMSEADERKLKKMQGKINSSIYKPGQHYDVLQDDIEQPQQPQSQIQNSEVGHNSIGGSHEQSTSIPKVSQGQNLSSTQGPSIVDQRRHTRMEVIQEDDLENSRASGFGKKALGQKSKSQFPKITTSTDSNGLLKASPDKKGSNDLLQTSKTYSSRHSSRIKQLESDDIAAMATNNVVMNYKQQAEEDKKLGPTMNLMKKFQNTEHVPKNFVPVHERDADGIKEMQKRALNLKARFEDFQNSRKQSIFKNKDDNSFQPHFKPKFQSHQQNQQNDQESQEHSLQSNKSSGTANKIARTNSAKELMHQIQQQKKKIEYKPQLQINDVIDSQREPSNLAQFTEAQKQRNLQNLAIRVQTETSQMKLEIGDKETDINRMYSASMLIPSASARARQEDLKNSFLSIQQDEVSQRLINSSQSKRDRKVKLDDNDPFILAKNPRKTLLDKVITNVFGDKRKVYEKYPELAELTVPKYPVIKPKGNEVINRQQFKVSLELLNEIIQEQRKQEIAQQDSENTKSHGSNDGGFMSTQARQSSFLTKSASASRRNSGSAQRRNSAAKNTPNQSHLNSPRLRIPLTNSKSVQKPAQQPAFNRVGNSEADALATSEVVKQIIQTQGQQKYDNSNKMLIQIDQPSRKKLSMLQIGNKTFGDDDIKKDQTNFINSKLLETVQQANFDEIVDDSLDRDHESVNFGSPEIRVQNIDKNKKSQMTNVTVSSVSRDQSDQDDLYRHVSIQSIDGTQQEQQFLTRNKDIVTNLKNTIQLRKTATMTDLDQVNIEMLSGNMPQNLKTLHNFTTDEHLLGLNAIEVFDQMNVSKQSLKKMRNQAEAIQQDSRATFRDQKEIICNFKNIIENLKKSQELQQAIEAKPRPIIDNNGNLQTQQSKLNDLNGNRFKKNQIAPQSLKNKKIINA